jgi:hypothetical protein
MWSANPISAHRVVDLRVVIPESMRYGKKRLGTMQKQKVTSEEAGESVPQKEETGLLGWYIATGAYMHTIIFLGFR